MIMISCIKILILTVIFSIIFGVSVFAMYSTASILTTIGAPKLVIAPVMFSAGVGVVVIVLEKFKPKDF
jgi:hypothetical protein